MDVRGKSVFLSGPMSTIEHYNVGEFAKAHAIVKEAGAYDVYDPAIEYLTSDGQTRGRGHEYWMRKCIHELTGQFSTDVFCASGVRRYSLLVSLPGWESSEGAKLERMVAEACGIEVCDLSEVCDAGWD